MRTLILGVFLCALSARAQTYVNVPFTNGPVSGAITNSLNVPANTLFELVDLSATGGGSTLQIYVTYPGMAEMKQSYPYQYNSARAYPILGPATVKFTLTLDANGSAMCLAKFHPVNTSTDLSGFAVQAPQNSVNVSLETSTNLTTWQPATNGTYAATNQARFFRMNMSVSK